MGAVREAIRAGMKGLNGEQVRELAGACGMSPTTLYQCGEQGMTCSFKAEMVGVFCARVHSDLLLRAIEEETLEAMDRARNRGQMHLPGTVTEVDLARKAHAVEWAVWQAVEDERITRREVKTIWKRLNEFVRTLIRFEWGWSRGPRPGQLVVREKF